MVNSNKNIYVGNRYVPKIFGQWDNEKEYEALSVVLYEGGSYTSKKPVPVGIDISNEEFWVLTGNYNVQVENYRQLVNQYRDDIIGFKDDINNKMADEVGVNPALYGAVMDGVHDDYDAIMVALENHRHVLIPVGATLTVSKPIHLKRWQSLIGAVPNVRNYGNNPRIKYIGEKAPRQALILMGHNEVGSEPVNDGTNIVLKNINIDCNELIGFGVYGTYLTNETLVDNVTVENSLEYGFYFAKSWYATYTNLTSLRSYGKGLAFGMPLEYLDGKRVVWSSNAPLEMNTTKIDNVRAHSSGRHFSEPNPNTYDPTNKEINRLAYGVGAGMGNGFNMSNVTSERSGGVNLY